MFSIKDNKFFLEVTIFSSMLTILRQKQQVFCQRKLIFLKSIVIRGSVAVWFKAVVLATSLFGGAGSNLTAGSILYQSKQITCLSLKL
jgi:hypothetical protein